MVNAHLRQLKIVMVCTTTIFTRCSQRRVISMFYGLFTASRIFIGVCFNEVVFTIRIKGILTFLRGCFQRNGSRTMCTLLGVASGRGVFFIVKCYSRGRVLHLVYVLVLVCRCFNVLVQGFFYRLHSIGYIVVISTCRRDGYRVQGVKGIVHVLFFLGL